MDSYEQARYDFKKALFAMETPEEQQAFVLGARDVLDRVRALSPLEGANLVMWIGNLAMDFTAPQQSMRTVRGEVTMQEIARAEVITVLRELGPMPLPIEWQRSSDVEEWKLNQAKWARGFNRLIEGEQDDR